MSETFDMGQYIQNSRKSKELTQKQVSQLTGLTVSTISGIESGYTRPSVNTLTKIAMVLKLDMNVLCGIKRPSRIVNCDMLTEKQYMAVQIIVDEMSANDENR